MTSIQDTIFDFVKTYLEFFNGSIKGICRFIKPSTDDGLTYCSLYHLKRLELNKIFKWIQKPGNGRNQRI
jgi:hypothetical protein